MHVIIIKGKCNLKSVMAEIIKDESDLHQGTFLGVFWLAVFEPFISPYFSACGGVLPRQLCHFELEANCVWQKSKSAQLGAT